MIQRSHQTAPTQFVNAADVRFAYRRFGKAGGVPLVFNMHFTGTMDHWDPLVSDGLAATREVILFDKYQYPALFVADVTRFLDAEVPFPIQKDTDHG